MSPVTADAGTNTGASLCLPPASSSNKSSSSKSSCSNSQLEDQEPGVVAGNFSIGTSANTSVLSQSDNANMHLDFHSFGEWMDGYSSHWLALLE